MFFSSLLRFLLNVLKFNVLSFRGQTAKRPSLSTIKYSMYSVVFCDEAADLDFLESMFLCLVTLFPQVRETIDQSELSRQCYKLGVIYISSYIPSYLPSYNHEKFHCTLNTCRGSLVFLPYLFQKGFKAFTASLLCTWSADSWYYTLCGCKYTQRHTCVWKDSHGTVHTPLPLRYNYIRIWLWVI